MRSYTPDFKVWNSDHSFYYVEVKGWMDEKSKEKIALLKKYYPHIDLRIVGKKEYRDLAKQKNKFPYWE